MIKNQCAMAKDDIVFNLKQGLESERRALDLYQRLSPMLQNGGDGQTKINHIISEEQRHIEIINQLIEVVDKYYRHD